jgi:hypothetical protein
MAKRKPNHQRAEVLAGVRGLRRERHFAEGGTLASWRGGNAVTIPNKKRKANREACRRNELD